MRSLRNAQFHTLAFSNVGVHNSDVLGIFDRILPLNVAANTAIFYVVARHYVIFVLLYRGGSL